MPVVLPSTVGLGLLAVLAGALGRTSLARRVAGWWGRAVLWSWGVEVTVSGQAPTGPAVYAANHGSALDIPLVLAYLPVDFRVMHKRSLYALPLIGQYLFVGGHIPIDRGNPFRAGRSLSHAASRIRGGTSVLVFPEGTRNPETSGVRPFKRGSFVLALTAGVPVVPVSLCGVKRVVPRGLLRLRPGRIHMTVHEAVPTTGLSLDDAGALAARVWETVAAGCRESAA